MAGGVLLVATNRCCPIYGSGRSWFACLSTEERTAVAGSTCGEVEGDGDGDALGGGDGRIDGETFGERVCVFVGDADVEALGVGDGTGCTSRFIRTKAMTTMSPARMMAPPMIHGAWALPPPPGGGPASCAMCEG